MTQALEQRTYTREEYLELEVASEERHEYLILPMPKGEGILEESTSEPSKAITKRP